MPDPSKPPTPDDPLAQLSERLQAAQETAERLVREATEAAEQAAAEGADAASERPPPRGYASPGSERRGGADAQALVALIELARAIVPPELRVQLAELVREVLLAVRALIDWYLERVEARRRAPVDVEDIPIG
jgi:hypothetical protein